LVVRLFVEERRRLKIIPCQWRAESPEKWRRKIPQFGGLAISRWLDRRLRFWAVFRGA
jgi:hypothetical protein